MNGYLHTNNLLRQNNGKLILQDIFNSGVTTRAQVARDLSLNKSTVSSIYNDLIKTRIIKEGGDGESSTNGGRKPTLVSINGRNGYTISFDIAYNNLHYMVNYLDGEIIKHESIMINNNIHEILKLIDNIINNLENFISSENGLLGIAISYHGVVSNNQIISSPFLNLDNVDLNDYFQTKYPNVIFVIDNESNLTAVYERDFEHEMDTNNSITISIHKGIGAGIIIDKKVFRGSTGESGEIGNSLTVLPNGKVTKIEDVCSEDAIITLIEQKIGKSLDRNEIVKLYNDNNKIVIENITQFINIMSLNIYNLSKSFNPQSIFISSPLIEQIPEILTKINHRISNFSNNFDAHIYLINNSVKATLLGACSLITHSVLNLQGYELNFSNKKD